MIDLILSYISSTVLLLPLIIAIYRNKYLTIEFRILFLYIIGAIIYEAFGNYWSIVLHKPNHFIINTFTVFECTMIGFMYNQVFRGRKIKKLTYATIGIYAVFSVIVFTERLSFERYNGMVSAISCLLVITWVFIYFYQLLQTLQVKKLSILPMFWISVSCLLYFSGTLFLFLYGEMILFNKNMDLYLELWNIYYVLSFIFRIFLAIGLWFSKTPLQLKSSSK